jgi:hypothetical protein
VTTLQTDRTRFEVHSDGRYFVAHLFDGSEAPGEPHEDPTRYDQAAIEAYRQRAAEVGLSDVWQMSLQHDTAHQIVAEAFNWPSSFSLWVQANGPCRKCGAAVRRLPSSAVIDWEDTLAFAVQRAANGLDWDREALWWLRPEAVEKLAGRLKALLREATDGTD